MSPSNTPAEPADSDDVLSSELQLRAIGNVVRHRILILLRTEPASISQVAARLEIAKGSASYHMRLLEKAGLVHVVSTRKVRGVTERHYARKPGPIRLPEPEAGQPDTVMRHALADLEAAPSGTPRLVRLQHSRLSPEKYAEFIGRLEALMDELGMAEDHAEPMSTLAVTLFRPIDPQ